MISSNWLGANTILNAIISIAWAGLTDTVMNPFRKNTSLPAYICAPDGVR
jgi:hypothetical protein